MLKKSAISWSVKQIHKMNNNGKLNFDLSIQRNSNVWDNERKSLLIHSYIEGYPIPPFYATELDGIYSFLDGKQRMTSTFQFLNDEYTLTNVPNVTVNDQEYIIDGKKYSELPEDVQDDINSTMLTVYKFDSITDEEIDELFFRLNNGVPLTKFELTRCKASHIMNFITDVTKQPIFEKINLSEKQMIRYADQEITLQILNALYTDFPSFVGKDLQEFAESFNMTPEQQEEMKTLLNYMDSALTGIEEKTYKKFMKKVHIPVIIKTARKAVNYYIGADEYGKFLVNFFIEENKPKGTNYNNAARSGSAKKENIKIRIDVMMKSFDRHFAGINKEEKVS
jgi:hypothetical protein